LFGDKPPPNLPTIASCHPCNGGKSEDDCFLRDILVSELNGSQHPVAREILRTNVASAIGSGKSPLLKTLHDGNFTLIKVWTPSGLLVDSAKVVLPDNRLEKIIFTMILSHTLGGQMPNRIDRPQRRASRFTFDSRSLLIASLLSMAIVGCAEDARTPSERIVASVARDSTAKTAPDSTIADTSSYIPIGSDRLALRELDDLVIVVDPQAVAAKTIIDNLMQNVGVSPKVESELLERIGNMHLIRIRGANDSLRRSPARKLGPSPSLDFVVPVFVTTEGRADTLYFSNELMVEFLGNSPDAELVRFEQKFDVKLLRRPARDSGYVITSASI